MAGSTARWASSGPERGGRRQDDADVGRRTFAPRDVDEVVRLSTEAWDTWESTFGTRVTGLFRQSGNPGNVARLLRIVWYRSYDGWVDSRDAERDPEARRRFAARRLLQLEGSGIAIATNRMVR